MDKSIYSDPRWQQLAALFRLKPVVIHGNKHFSNLYIKNGIVSNRLSQLPCVDWFEPDTEKDNISEFIEKAEHLAQKSGAELDIYLRARPDQAGWSECGIVYYELPTDKEYGEVFQQSFHKKTRNMVRKAENNHIKIRSSGDVTTFYKLYIKTMQKLGYLPLPKEVFEETREVFSKESILLEAQHDRASIGYLWLFEYNQTFWIWANATNPATMHLGTNYALYSEAIRLGCSKPTIKLVNFGNSTQSSPQAFFKSRWGGVEKPVYSRIAKSRPVQSEVQKNIIRFTPNFILPIMSKVIYAWY